VNVPSVYRAMEKETINRVAKDVLLDLADVAAIFRKRFPMPPADLNKKLEGVKITTLEDVYTHFSSVPLFAIHSLYHPCCS
jgi:hypothetical protein